MAATTFGYGCRRLECLWSANVVAVTDEFGMVTNGGVLGVAVEIMSLAGSFRSIVTSTPGFGGRPIGVRSSVNVGQCREHNTQVRLGKKWGQLKSLRLSS